MPSEQSLDRRIAPSSSGVGPSRSQRSSQNKGIAQKKPSDGSPKAMKAKTSACHQKSERFGKCPIPKCEFQTNGMMTTTQLAEKMQAFDKSSCPHRGQAQGHYQKRKSR